MNAGLYIVCGTLKVKRVAINTGFMKPKALGCSVQVHLQYRMIGRI